MSAALAGAILTRRCGLCRNLRPLEDFTGPTSAYCRPCKSAYNSQRAKAVRAGTWVPGVTPILPPSAPKPVSPLPEPIDAEDRLRAAMANFAMQRGFSALRNTCARIEGEIARANRIALAREGWIA